MSIEKRTSSMVTGFPSWNRASGLMSKTQVWASSVWYEEAIAGIS